MTREQYEESRRLADQLRAELPKLGGDLKHQARVLLNEADAKLLMYEVAHGIRR